MNSSTIYSKFGRKSKFRSLTNAEPELWKTKLSPEYEARLLGSLWSRHTGQPSMNVVSYVGFIIWLVFSLRSRFEFD